MRNLNETTKISISTCTNAEADCRNDRDPACTYDSCRDALIIRPVHRSNCQGYLSRAVYRQIGTEIMLVLYAVVAEDTDNLVTGVVHLAQAQRWAEEEGISLDVIFDRAMHNTQAKYAPIVYRSMADACMDNAMSMAPLWSPNPAERAACLRQLKSALAGQRQIALSTTRKMNGAIAIFYPGMLSQLHSILGCDFYVGFLSTGEALLSPCSTANPRYMRDSIRDLNRLINMPRDVLSNALYRCTGNVLQEIIE